MWLLNHTLKGWCTALYSTDTIAVYSERELRVQCLGNAIKRNCPGLGTGIGMGRLICCVCQHWPLDLWRKRCYRRRPKLFPQWSLRHRDILVWHQIRKVIVSIWESNTAWLETLRITRKAALLWQLQILQLWHVRTYPGQDKSNSPPSRYLFEQRKSIRQKQRRGMWEDWFLGNTL